MRVWEQRCEVMCPLLQALATTVEQPGLVLIKYVLNDSLIGTQSDDDDDDDG